MNYLIDTHAHLDHLENLENALSNAQSENIKMIVAMSMGLKSCADILKIAEKYTQPKIYPCLGMHPSEIKDEEVEECLDLIRKNKDKIVAVGEIGLDFWYQWVRKDQEQKDKQRRVYRKFLQIAHKCDLPVVVHSRGAWREAFETAKELGLKKANFHWYSGPIDVLEDIIEYGYFISTAPSIAYSSEVIAAVKSVPITQLLIETDSPVYFRNKVTGDGFQSEPKDVRRTLASYCQLMNMNEESAATQFNNNASHFFNFPLD